jgi:hypothetical protein
MKDIYFKHTQKIKSIDIDNTTLANEIGDLYYDSLGQFLDALSSKLLEDSLQDQKKGRLKLATSLKNASASIKEASKEIRIAWDISSPHVKDWIKENASNRENEN